MLSRRWACLYLYIHDVSKWVKRLYKNLTELLGDIKEDWRSGRRKSSSRVQGRSPGRGSGGLSPPEAEAFCETTHNICIKIQQTTVVAVIHFPWVSGHSLLCSLDITSKILGETLPWTSPFINIGGTFPPCPIGTDTPVYKASLIK